MVPLTIAGDLFMWLLIAAFLYIFKGKTCAVYYLTLLLIIWLVVYGMKLLFMVPRPETGRILVDAAGYSFPSSHTALAFGTATFLHSVSGKSSYFFWIFAIMMGISRIVVGVHYPSDVIAGAIAGIILGYVGLLLYPAFVRKVKKFRID
jgi:undecaprenyl-diphosphatase